MPDLSDDDFAIKASGEAPGDGTFTVHMECQSVQVMITMPLPGADGSAAAAAVAPVVFQTIPQTVDAVLAALEKQAAEAAGEDSQ